MYGYRKWKKAAAASVAAAMTLSALPTAAFAEEQQNSEAVIEELNKIMEAQQENEPDSPVEEMLGLENFGEKANENGISLQAKVSLPESAAELIDAADMVKDGNYIRMNTQVDQKQKKWQFDLGAAAEAEKELLTISLYGDDDMFAVTIPQFYSGALAIRSGSLQKQIDGSAAAQMLGAGEVKLDQDIDLDFFPNFDEMSSSLNMGTDFSELLEQKSEELEKSMTAEKSEEDGKTVYTVSVPTKEVTGIYRDLVNAYMQALDQMEAVTMMGVDEFEAQFDEMMSTVEMTMDETIQIHFLVENELVTEIAFDVNVDANRLPAVEADLDGAVEDAEEAVLNVAEDAAEAESAAADDIAEAESAAADDTAETESAAEAETEAVETADAAEAKTETVTTESDPANVLNLKYVFTYHDPEKPYEGFDMTMDGASGDGTETIGMKLSMSDARTETTSDSKIDLTLVENGETLYDDTVFTSAFDAATGAYNMAAQFQSDDTKAVLALDSNLTNVVKGESFDWEIHSLGMTVDGETLGIEGTVSAKADPGQIETPQEVRMLFELTQEELSSLLSEVQMKALTWASQFQPETESEPIVYDEETEVGAGA